MSTGYKIEEQEGLYYLTLQVVGWIDIFTRQAYRDIVVDNLKYCQKHKGLDIFPLMPHAKATARVPPKIRK